MKKVLATIICIACLCTLLVLPASAAINKNTVTELAPAFKLMSEVVVQVDQFFDGSIRTYAINSAKEKWESNGSWGTIIDVPAAEFEAEVNKYCVLDDAMLSWLRGPGPDFYNANTNTYSIRLGVDGMGAQREREYRGAVKTGENTYDVYLERSISFLYDDMGKPDWNTFDKYVEEHRNADGYVEYGGKLYRTGMDGYFTELKNSGVGRKYSVSVNGEIVRFLADYVEFGVGDMPKTFDDKIVTQTTTFDTPDSVELTQGSHWIPSGSYFKVERLTSGNVFETAKKAVESVGKQVYVFRIGATLNGKEISCDGIVELCIRESEFCKDSARLFYIGSDGKAASENGNYDATRGCVVAKPTHFGTYVLVLEGSAAPTEATKAPATAATKAPATAATKAPATAATKAPATAATKAPATAATKAPATAATKAPATAATKAPATVATKVPDAQNKPTQATEAHREDSNTKLEIVDKVIEEIPQALIDAGLDTVDKIEEKLINAAKAVNENTDNSAFFDVTLMFNKDGKEWVKADNTHFPENGKLTVTLPYPEGTDATYRFTVAHMFTTDAFGKVPGEVETPDVINTAGGIQFEVTGLSPITITWSSTGAGELDEPIPEATEAATEATTAVDDSANEDKSQDKGGVSVGVIVAIVVVVLAVAGAAVWFFLKKKK